jgi:PAS domain S-box-containing protein
VTLYVTAVAAAGSGLLAAVLVLDPPGRGDLAIAAVVAAALVVQPFFTQRFNRGHGQNETLTSDEAAFAALLVVVSPSLAVLALVLPAMLTEIFAHRTPIKAIFNIGSFSVAAAVPALLLLAGGADTTVALAMGAMAGALLLATISQVLLSGVLMIVGAGSFRALLLDDIGFRTGQIALNVLLGGLGGVAVAGEIVALPLVIVAILAGHLGVLAYARTRAGHDQLRRTQERLRRALQTSQSAAWEFDLEAESYAWSENLEAVSGTGELIPIGLALEPADRKRIALRIASGDSICDEVQITWPDGSRHWLEIHADVVKGDSGTAVLRGFTRVIDHKKEMEAEREAANELAQQSLLLLDRVGDAHVSIDRDWRVVYANRAGEEMLGRSRAALVGVNLWEEWPDIAGGPFEAVYRSAMDGGEPVPFEGEYEALGLHVSGVAYPAPEGISIVWRDVKAERELEEQLRQSQKMEAIGQLAGGVAHDFNNLLTAINGNAELALDEPGLTPELACLVEEIRTAGGRAAELTQQLLAFSRRQVLQPQELELSAAVCESESLIRRLLGAAIEVEVSGSAGAVHADPGRISQVLLNLAVNARDAMPAGGKLTICTEQVETAGEAGVPDGSWVRLSVSDTGPGIPEDVQQRIFEPFFTTKDQGKGTGLGLSTVFGIVTQYAGHVTVSSEPGAGATFNVYLPAATAPQLQLSEAR